MPEGVAQIKKAVFHPDIPPLFKGAFAIRRALEGAIHHTKILFAIKSAFLIETLPTNRFHIVFLHFSMGQIGLFALI